MRFPRYIIQKPTEPDLQDKEQEDYKLASDFFITRQSTQVPDDFEPGALERVRFGINWFLPQNYAITVHSDGNPTGVPVHDACWKIFERVSKSRLGEVDLHGFMALWYVCISRPKRILRQS